MVLEKKCNGHYWRGEILLDIVLEKKRNGQYCREGEGYQKTGLPTQLLHKNQLLQEADDSGIDDDGDGDYDGDDYDGNSCDDDDFDLCGGNLVKCCSIWLT